MENKKRTWIGVVFLFIIVATILLFVRQKPLAVENGNLIASIEGSYSPLNYNQSCYNAGMQSTDNKLVGTSDVSAGYTTSSSCNCYTLTETGGKIGCWKAVGIGKEFQFSRNVIISKGDNIKIDFSYNDLKSSFYVTASTRAVLWFNGNDFNYCKENRTGTMVSYYPNGFNNQTGMQTYYVLDGSPMPNVDLSKCIIVTSIVFIPIELDISTNGFYISPDGVNWQKCGAYILKTKLPNGDCSRGQFVQGSVSCASNFDSKQLYVKMSKDVSSGYIQMWDWIKVYSSVPPIIPTVNCSKDSDCGINRDTGKPNYCQNNNVYSQFITFTCKNAGTAYSFCSNTTIPYLIDNCILKGQTCVDGFCKSICTPNCVGKVCGDDGCGGSCGSCPSGYYCSNGNCVYGIYNPADTNKDGKVDFNELVAYAGLWKSGSVSFSDLINVATTWKGG